MKCLTRSLRTTRSETGGGAIAEFGPALFILFVIVLLPMVGLFTFVDAAGIIYFATSTAARSAGSANTKSEAEQAMKGAANQIIGGPMGAFANLTPSNADGMELTVLQVNLDSEAVSPFAPPVDTDKNFYEFQVTSNYSTKPLFYPGPPIPLTFQSSSHVEHPEGLGQ